MTSNLQENKQSFPVVPGHINPGQQPCTVIRRFSCRQSTRHLIKLKEFLPSGQVNWQLAFAQHELIKRGPNPRHWPRMTAEQTETALRHLLNTTYMAPHWCCGSHDAGVKTLKQEECRMVTDTTTSISCELSCCAVCTGS